MDTLLRRLPDCIILSHECRAMYEFVRNTTIDIASFFKLIITPPPPRPPHTPEKKEESQFVVFKYSYFFYIYL